MSIFIGLNVGYYLSDVNNQNQALRNLGLNRLDLDHIRGAQELGVTTSALHNLSGLDIDQEKRNWANYQSSLSVTRSLEDIGGVNLETDFNLRISHQLRAGAIKYNYADYSGGGAPTIKSADISTSRVSSWSQVLDGPTHPTTGEPTPGPIFYGADTTIQGANGTSIIEVENIEFTGELSAKRFDAEVPTHRVDVNINGTTRRMFTMRNIPFRFEGVFNRAKIRMKTNANALGQTGGTFRNPTLLFINTAIPEGQLGREIPITGSSTDSTFVYQPGGSGVSDVYIDIYNDPAKVTYLDFYDEGDKSQKTLRLSKFPKVEMKRLSYIDLSHQDFPEMPDFFDISGGNDSSHTTNNQLRQIYMYDNDLSRTGVSAQTQLTTKVPSCVTHLGLRATFTDGTPIDIRQLPSSGNRSTLEDSNLTHLYWDGRYYRTETTRRLLATRDTNANSVSPYVNGNKIKRYEVGRHQFKYLNHEVTHNSYSKDNKTAGQPNELTQLWIYGNYMFSQLDASGNITGDPIQVPDTITHIHCGANNLEAIDVSGKDKLIDYIFYYNRGYINPPSSRNGGTISGYFTGCTSLEYIHMQNSYATAPIQTLFAGLPSLQTAYFDNTRLTGRMLPSTFIGTTQLDTFTCTKCNFDSTGGSNQNFFGNDFEAVVAEPPPGGLGGEYEGGYFAGTLFDNAGEQYHLVVADKQHELFLPRYDLDDSLQGLQGSTSANDGETATSEEYGGDSEYQAAAAVSQLNVDGYSDWYIPAQHELELMYRTLKPTNDQNYIFSNPLDNQWSSFPGPFQGNYTANVPGKNTTYPSSQAFNSTTNHGSSLGVTEYLTNNNFSSGTSPWANDAVYAAQQSGVGGTYTLSNSGGKLVATMNARGNAGITTLLPAGSTLPIGTYEITVNFAEVTKALVSSGDFISGREYEIVSVGTPPSFSPSYSDFDKGNDRITIGTSHVLTNGTKVTYSHGAGVTGGFTGLTDGASYFVVNKTQNTIKLSSSIGGPAIGLDDDLETISLTITGGNGTDYQFGSGTDRGGSITTNDPTIELYTGDTLTLTNNSGGHPLQFETAGGAVLASESGGTITYTFPTAGTYYYQCTSHAAMRGQITVSARAGTFSIIPDQNANWDDAGADSSPTQGEVFTATNNGERIYNATVTPLGIPGGANQDANKVFVTVDPRDDASDYSTTSDLVVGEQGLTNSPVTLKLYLPVQSAAQHRMSIISLNCNFKINSITVRNQVGIYWSSTEGPNTVKNNGLTTSTGMAQNFQTGQQIEASKGSVYNIRPVRRVTVASPTSSEKQGTSSVFQPCGGNLRVFRLEGKGKDVSTGPNIRGKMPNVSYLTEIENFELTKTQINGTMPDFNNSVKLKKLIMFENNLTGIFSINNVSVKNVQFQNNEFTGASNIKLLNAWNLNLSNNNITGTFPNLSESRNLSNINFENNNIQNYQSGSLSNNIYLNTLNLSRNNLTLSSAKRLLEDIQTMQIQADRGGISINLRSNPLVTETAINLDFNAKAILDFLRGKGCTVNMNA